MTYVKQKSAKWRKFITKDEQAMVDEYERKNAELSALRAQVMQIRGRATSRAIRHRSKSCNVY